MLEDESGRIRLVGERLKSAQVVTGVIMGALGLETANGDFEVVDFCFAGRPPQPHADEDGMDVNSKLASIILACFTLIVISEFRTIRVGRVGRCGLWSRCRCS